MWVGTEFAGDDNEVLKLVQHDAYGGMLGELFSRPRERYLDACDLLQVNNELADKIRPMRTFDHRRLQDAHDLIAAGFRFSQGGSTQLRLGETAEAYQRRLAAEWRDFFEREVSTLSEDNNFARAVLLAAALANTPKGENAEDELRVILKRRYPGLIKPVST